MQDMSVPDAVPQAKDASPSEGESSGSGVAPSKTSETKPAKKRASRAGTRSVSTLSQAQLARKRANDREAQRAIRQRTKEHIENLERRIEELTGGGAGDASSLAELRRRNEELENELRRLRGSISAGRDPNNEAFVASGASTTPRNRSANSTLSSSSIPPHHGYANGGGHSNMTVPSHSLPPSWWSGNASQRPPLTSSISGSSEEFANLAVASPMERAMPQPLPQAPVFVNTSGPSHSGLPLYSPGGHRQMNGYQVEEMTGRQWAQDPTAIDHIAFSNESDSPVLSRMPSLTSSVVGTENRNISYNPPTLNSCEIPVRVSSPTGLVDNMLLTLLQSRRHLASIGVTGPDLLGTSEPDMKALLYPERTSQLDPLSRVITEIIQSTLLQELPEKVACLYVMWFLAAWMIQPCAETYQKLPENYAPIPSQLITSHPIWMDQMAWPKMRDMCINRQDLYNTEEFQHMYTSSLSLNWPYRHIDTLKFVDGPDGGEIRISPMFKAHVLNLGNWSMKAPFSKRYPEMGTACRFS